MCGVVWCGVVRCGVCVSESLKERVYLQTYSLNSSQNYHFLFLYDNHLNIVTNYNSLLKLTNEVKNENRDFRLNNIRNVTIGIISNLIN